MIGGPGRYVAHYSLDAFPPMAYRRPGDDSLYYVEGDGRHLAAIARDGVVLWREDLFTQAKLEQYRVKEPKFLAWARRRGATCKVGPVATSRCSSTRLSLASSTWRPASSSFRARIEAST